MIGKLSNGCFIIALIFLIGCSWSIVPWIRSEPPLPELNSKVETIAMHVDSDIVSMVVVSAKEYTLGSRIRIDVKALDINIIYCSWDATVPPSQTLDLSLFDSRETSLPTNFFTPKKTGKHILGVWCASPQGSIYILINIYVGAKRIKVDLHKLMKTDAILLQ